MDATCETVAQALAGDAALAPWRLGQAQETLWIGFSGGLDSTVLVHALRGYVRAKAIHINHGLDARAADWARHCATTAAAFGLPIETRAVAVSRQGNLQAAARRARYACWRRLLRAGDVLVLAHHADDQAETRLWQLLTGRHPGGMPAARALGAGRVIRPLLGVARGDIAAYAERHRLRWVADPANADLRFDRNFIRHRLLPILAERFPHAVERLRAPRPAPVAADAPLRCSQAAKPRVEAWLLASGLPLGSRAADEIVRQNAAAPDRQPRVDVAPCTLAWRYDGAWHLVRMPGAERLTGERVATVGDAAGLPAGRLCWRPAAVGLSRGRRLAIRQRRGGERIRPAGRGVGKTLKSLFQEHRIAPWLRPWWPLLYDGERLVGVPGLAIAEHAAVPDGLFPEWTPMSSRPGGR